jgi:AAA domain, putative AbiEii toxin, Type IV TA system
LNHHDVLARSQTLLDMDQRRSGRLGLSFTTLHTKDLFDKLRTPVLPFDLLSPSETMGASRVLADLQALIDGEVAYDKSERDFVFRRPSGTSISIKNTASGIKVFGLLKILVANEFVAKDTLLIFDEPENHLHPKWQLKLAQVLIKLVESGVYVLVSSHSPYLIEALKRGADRAGLTAEARFALAQDKQIQDEDRLSDIFSPSKHSGKWM